MTPVARISAAIEVLDTYLSGQPLEKVLTNWARGHRFAGSGDRAAIRDHVYDVLRNKRSFAALGGEMSGRGLMIGALRARGLDLDGFFCDARFAPAPLSEDEKNAGQDLETMSELAALDCPDWLADELRSSLSDSFTEVMTALKTRAPVFLRVNTRRATRTEAADMLNEDGIVTRPHDLSETALEVIENERRIRNSAAYTSGLVELQDVASQFVADQIPLTSDMRVLDYCAGGGGKSLALAARSDAVIFAHDINPDRMSDLPARAARSGVNITLVPHEDIPVNGSYNVVLVDAPCSGSGAWRRSPEAKWTLTNERLSVLCDVQKTLLEEAAGLVTPGGILAYVTCSVLARENTAQVAEFTDNNAEWSLVNECQLTPLDDGDGFFLAILKR